MKQSLLIIFTLLLSGCFLDNDYKNVGDLPFDESLDDENFMICNENFIKQYYLRRSSDEAPGYKDEKRGLERAILTKYNFPKTETENGYLTIRFIVNCKGESGRFRVEEMNFDYQAIKFDGKITNQLLDIVKNLDNWIPRKRKNKAYDFYQYLSFKIEAGQITKILP